MGIESKRVEYIWSTMERKVSPYSLVQNNNEYSEPIWAWPLAYIGACLLGLAIFYQLLQEVR